MERRSRRALHILGAFLLSVASTGAWGQGCLMWDWTPPSLPKFPEAKLEWRAGCYEITSGRANPLDCHFLFEIGYDASGVEGEDLKNYAGGHLHPPPAGMDPARPVGKIACSAGTPSGDGRSVEGQTLAQWVTVGYAAPEVSGTITWHIEYIFPRNRWAAPIQEPGWVWTKLVDDRWMAFTDACLKVGVGGLQEVTPLPGLYLRCGSAEGCGPGETVDPKHPQVFFLCMETQTSLGKLINKFYARYPDYKLAFLDMSLPQGGLLDCKYDWKKPHSLHRVGRSVDIMSRCPVPKDEKGNCPVPNEIMVWKTTRSGGYWVDIKREILDEMAEDSGFIVKKEQPVHYESKRG